MYEVLSAEDCNQIKEEAYKRIENLRCDGTNAGITAYKTEIFRAWYNAMASFKR